MPPQREQNGKEITRSSNNVQSDTEMTALDTFLAVAVEHSFIQPSEVLRIQSHAKSNNVSPSDAALSLAALATSEAQAIKFLVNPLELLPGYELKKLIGYGAGGMVFAARQLALERDVAVKTIRPSVQISNSVSRMQCEALSIARLQHPNIVSVYDSSFSNGRFCIAMELVEGGSLADRIRHDGPLSELTSWHIARQVASALHHANERGIIHRDIKPGNILLSHPPAGVNLPEGVPFAKVADFGLALERESTDAQLTATGTGLGTPSYVAPEQIDDSHVDKRADIYALGATVFHMLTGVEPYADTSPVTVITKKSTGDDSWRDKFTSELSAGSRQLFLELTECNADHRIGTYEDLIDRIDEVLLFASDRAVDPPSSVFDTERVNSEAATRTFTQIEHDRPESKPFPFRSLAAAVCLVAVLLLGYFGVRGFGNGSPAETNEPLILASDWQPEGFPTPLFNGQSVPRFRQTGVWQPSVAADGSRVLTGRTASTLNLPIAVEGSTHSRLRIGVSLKPEDEVAIEAKQEGKSVELLRLDNAVASIRKNDNQTNFDLPQPNSDTDVVFQRVEVLRSEKAVAVLVNGKQLNEMLSAGSEITLRCITGQPDFADIDLGRMSLNDFTP